MKITAFFLALIFYRPSRKQKKKKMLDILKWIVYNLNTKRLYTIKNETI